MADGSGAWLGTYWQAGQPNRFEATFVQGGNTLSGNILDDNSLGEAQVVGTVVGRQVHFTKRYVTGSPIAIDYTGTVSEDEKSIQGVWQITSTRDRGTWEATRNGENLVADLSRRLALAA